MQLARFFLGALLLAAPLSQCAGAAASDGRGTWVLNLPADGANTTDANGAASVLTSAVFPELAAVGLTAARVTLAPCSMLPPHYHPNAEEIAHVLSGKAYAVQFNETGHQFVTNLTAGDVQVVPAGMLHSLVNDNCTPLVGYVVWTTDQLLRVSPLEQVLAMPEQALHGAAGLPPDQPGAGPLQGVAAAPYLAPLNDAACTARCSGSGSGSRRRHS